MVNLKIDAVEQLISIANCNFIFCIDYTDDSWMIVTPDELDQMMLGAWGKMGQQDQDKVFFVFVSLSVKRRYNIPSF